MKNPIHVYGWYGHDNLGDEAYKLAFPILFPEREFIFCDSLKNINPEVVILGGGDIFYPKMLEELKKYECRKIAMSVNLRPEQLEYYSMFESIVSRNIVEIKDFSKLPPNIHCFPDFTFCLEGNKERGQVLLEKMFKEAKSELYKDIVIFTMNSYLCMKHDMLARDYISFEKACMELSNIMDNTSASFVFLPFGNGFPINDRIANSAIYTRCKWWKKNLLVFDKLGIQDTLDLYAAADAAIGSRLHSCIFSCIGETPFVNLCHHSKTRYFTEFIGKPHWSVDYWHFCSYQVKELLHDFLKNKEFHKAEIREISRNTRKVLSKVKNIDFNI